MDEIDKRRESGYQVCGRSVDTGGMRLSVQKFSWVLTISLALPAAATQAREVRYAARLDQSQWQLKASRAECVLSHEIPDYGQAHIVQRHAEDARFSINVTPEASLADNAVIRAVPPKWNHIAKAAVLGQQPIRMDSSSLVLDADTTLNMMIALERGMNLEFSFQPGSNVVAVVSTVRFIPAMNDFYACVAKLSPTVLVQNKPEPKPKPMETSAKDRPAENKKPKPVLVSPPSTGIALAYSSVEFTGAEDSLSEVALSTLTGIAREFLQQQKSKKVHIVISGVSATDAVYKSRAAMISLHLVGQGIAAEAIKTIGRGQLPRVKNVRPEQPPANTLQIHLMQ